MARLQQHLPVGYALLLQPTKQNYGIDVPTNVVAMDFLLVTNDKVPDDTIYNKCICTISHLYHCYYDCLSEVYSVHCTRIMFFIMCLCSFWQKSCLSQSLVLNANYVKS